ncbi:putative MFS family arabinose efflux permease [Paraburkholderia sp. BL23I1N1]|nr:putative MFS family arabinose efflux permease [Paraburkholderia sp. BL23I1N1]
MVPRPTPAAFATAVSAYSWCSGLSGLFAATYIDRFDRRRLLLTVYALFALSNLACALSSSFPLLLVARAFAGITGGVLGSVIMAIVGDVIPVQRRGAATGTIMTAFSLAAIAGVPAGVMLGAHFTWAAPFYLLVVLSLLIWVVGWRLVPSLAEHLSRRQPSLGEVLPDLWRLLSNPRHMNAFALTFMMMIAHMVVIPFISPVLVANHGVAPAQLSWLYMAGGAATFFTSRRVGRLADRFGTRRVFRIAVILSFLPVLFVTHLPDLPFYALVMFFPFFMVLMSGRMIPMQALLTTVPEPARRGAFLSANSALQAVGTGCGAWIGGLMLSNSPTGQITGYGTVGWLGVAVALIGVFWVSRVHGAQTAKPSTGILRGDTVGEG